MFKDHPVLQIRDFRWLALNKFFFTIGLQMQSVIVAWQVYQMTRDPLALGLIGFFEAAAFISSALWAGHVADRSEKRRMILGSESVLLCGVLALLSLTLAHNRQVWLLYGVIAFSGLARSFLWTSSVAFAEQVVPKTIYSRAAAWNSSAWEIGNIAGPAIGGLLYASLGPSVAYAGVFAALATGFVFAFLLNPRPPALSTEKGSASADFLSGVRFVFSHQIILAALSLDMFAVLFGGAVALLPIFAERMQVGPTGLGLLRAAPSLGAILMATYQTRHPPFRQMGKTLFICVALFGLSMIAFGLSTHFWLSMALLSFSGLVDNVSVVARASILQASTPDPMRGRVSAVNGIFIGSSNEIGAFESGVAAKLIGTVPSVVFGGCMTLLTVAIVAWKAPQLRRLRSLNAPPV